MKAFEIKGQFMMSHRNWQSFTIEVASADEKAALDKVMALMGSRHKIKRKFIRIENVKSLNIEDVSDHAVKHLLEVKK